MEPYKTKELKWIGVDLDGTLADTKPPYFLLEKTDSIKQNADMVRAWHKSGFSIFIWSSRHWDDYNDVKKWLRRHKIPFKAIWLGKPLVKAVWDDRAFNPNCGECKERWKK